MDSLNNAQYVSLRTFRRSGVPVDTPVWFARSSNNTYHVFSAANAGKVKRLRNGSRIRVAPCTATGRVTGDWYDGTGRIVGDAATLERAYAALHAKYGWQMWIADTLSRLTGRYGKRAMLELSL